jgi:hypothetical protein
VTHPLCIRAWLLFAALAASVVGALALPPSVPPAVVAADAPSELFSAERAAQHLREITGLPRPVGSDAHARTRGYLEGALRQLGLEPEVQETTGVRRAGNTVRAARLVNLMARLPGEDSSGTLLLVSHYDSVPNAPGAADAGYGVTAILETLRALLHGPPLRNDLVVLFTDAEEVGLLGAQAFVADHPWAESRGVVLNLEARGHTGPVQMFRTSDENGGLLRLLAEAAPHPVAESLANEVFRRMPNDTDLTVFVAAGFAGLDFANVHGLTHYHTPLDSLANADLRTLQHHGSNTLALARAFGMADLASLVEADRSYFTLPVFGIVHYPLWLVPWLAVIAVVLAGTALRGAELRGGLRRREALYAVLHVLLMLVVLPALAWLAWRLALFFLPEHGWFRHGMPYRGGRYLLALCLLAAAGWLAALAWLRRRLAPAEMMAGAFAPWALLALLSAVWMPGASYLFTWPLVVGALVVAWRNLGRPAGGAADVAVLALAGLLLALMVVPVIDGVTQAMTLDAVAVPMVLFVLLLGLLGVHFDVVLNALGRRVAAGLAAAGLSLLVLTLATAGFDEQRRKPNEVHYLADLDVGEAVWYSQDPAPDRWTRFYLGDEPVRARLPEWAPAPLARQVRRVWQREAALVSSPGPRAELVSAAQDEYGRVLRLRVTAPRRTHSTVISFPGEPRITALRIDGREVETQPAWASPELQVVLFAIPARGMEVELHVAGDAPLELQLRANVLGLPPAPDGSVPVRPDDMMPAGQLGDLARLQRTKVF